MLWDAQPPTAASTNLQKIRSPLYFITFNTYRRKRLLANAQVHARFIEFAQKGQQRGVDIGRYVIMPDHIHLFVGGATTSRSHSGCGFLNKIYRKQSQQRNRIGQKGFFDHLVRHGESYTEKLDYVYQNPVRADLVRKADDWPWKGEIARLESSQRRLCQTPS